MTEGRISDSIRQIVRIRARWSCEYCRCLDSFSTGPFTLDHIVPKSRGGTDDPANLAWACPGCNGSKYTRAEAEDPATRSIVPLYNPRLQRWADHFRWVDDLTRIIGLTPTGRATVEALRLNRETLIALRNIYPTGAHPPPDFEG